MMALMREMAPLGKVVVEEELAQILRVHAKRHPRRIRIPCQKIGHRGTLTEQIFAHDAICVAANKVSVANRSSLSRAMGARGPESLGLEQHAIFAWNQPMGRLTVVK